MDLSLTPRLDCGPLCTLCMLSLCLHGAFCWDLDPKTYKFRLIGSSKLSLNCNCESELEWTGDL